MIFVMIYNPDLESMKMPLIPPPKIKQQQQLVVWSSITVQNQKRQNTGWDINITYIIEEPFNFILSEILNLSCFVIPPLSQGPSLRQQSCFFLAVQIRQLVSECNAGVPRNILLLTTIGLWVSCCVGFTGGCESLFSEVITSRQATFWRTVPIAHKIERKRRCFWPGWKTLPWLLSR